jgi:transcriptional regulator with XRE-family HTH domain
MIYVLRSLMTRSRPAHAIDDAWRSRVTRALEQKQWSRAELARRAGCPPSTITELLNGDAHQSPYVPAIHIALNWTPPLPPVMNEQAEQLMDAWQHLDEVGKARLLERALALLETNKKR